MWPSCRVVPRPKKENDMRGECDNRRLLEFTGGGAAEGEGALHVL